MESSLPEDWIAEAEEAIANPELFKFTGWENSDEWRTKRATQITQTVISSVLKEKYDLFSTRALAHSKTKGEHEIAAAINFYIIYKYKLWRAECDSWGEYTDYVGSSAFGVSKSTIEHDVLEIEKLLNAGMTFRNIISSMAVAKGATKRLAEVPKELLPGGDINKAAELLSQSSPHEAHKTVDDWELKTKIYANKATFDSTNNRFYFEVKIVKSDGDWKRKDYMIADVEREEAEWLMVRLQVLVKNREYK